MSGIGRYHYRQRSDERFDYRCLRGTGDSTWKVVSSGDTVSFAFSLLPPFPAASRIDSILGRVETYTEYTDSVVLSWADTARRYWYAVDRHRWVLTESRYCNNRADTCFGAAYTIHYAYEEMAGVHAIRSITASPPTMAGDSQPGPVPMLQGGYYFSNIVINEPLDDSLFVGSLRAGLWRGEADAFPARPMTRVIQTGRGALRDGEVFDLRGRRLVAGALLWLPEVHRR